MTNTIYANDIQQCIDSIPKETIIGKLRKKTILITGATGMIGSTLIDMLMELNHQYHLNLKIIALSRHEQDARERFADYWKEDSFSYVEHDMNHSLPDTFPKADYIFHGASNTHPRAYASDPIGTITTNVNGTQNLLEHMAKYQDSGQKTGERVEIEHICQKTEEGNKARFILFSSVEIYGENVSDLDKFAENDLGYIDCNTMRAGYPEGKRLGEALCNAYGVAKGVDFVIPRLSRVYGPTMRQTDSKAIAQFIHKAVAGEDIVLKSEGTQTYSYTYVADAALAVLYVALFGVSGEAYNIADAQSDIALKDLAGYLAEAVGKKVIFELPDACERAGYTTATKAMLDSAKIEALGWHALTHIKEGLQKTLEILKQNSH